MINRKLVLGVGVPVLLLALLGGFFAAYSFMPTKGAIGSWRDFRDATSLIVASERIVLATYLDEATHEIPTVTSDDGTVIGSVTETFRRFQIGESLKGDAQVGDNLYVVESANFKTALVGGGSETVNYEVLQLTAGHEYVLFLDSQPALAASPAQYGDTIWARPGEPGVAQVDSEGHLTFVATDRYKDAIEGKGLERAPGSDAPFEMTKEDITGSTPSE